LFFEPKQENEFLSELTAQLDGEAIEINNQLEKIRKQNCRKSLRNKQLRRNWLMPNPSTKTSIQSRKRAKAGPSMSISRTHERGDAFV